MTGGRLSERHRVNNPFLLVKIDEQESCQSREIAEAQIAAAGKAVSRRRAFRSCIALQPKAQAFVEYAPDSSSSCRDAPPLLLVAEPSSRFSTGTPGRINMSPECGRCDIALGSSGFPCRRPGQSLDHLRPCADRDHRPVARRRHLEVRPAPAPGGPPKGPRPCCSGPMLPETLKPHRMRWDFFLGKVDRPLVDADDTPAGVANDTTGKRRFDLRR